MKKLIVLLSLVLSSVLTYAQPKKLDSVLWKRDSLWEFMNGDTRFRGTLSPEVLRLNVNGSLFINGATGTGSNSFGSGQDVIVNGNDNFSKGKFLLSQGDDIAIFGTGVSPSVPLGSKSKGFHIGYNGVMIFEVYSNGAIKINNVAYRFPLIGQQIPPGSILTNNGFGILTWEPPSNQPNLLGLIEQQKEMINVLNKKVDALSKTIIELQTTSGGKYAAYDQYGKLLYLVKIQ